MSVQTVQPALPTLYSMSSPNLKKPGDIAIELINFMFKNPGFVSSVNENEMISYRRLIAQYGTEPDMLAGKMQEMLTGAMAHYFPDGGYAAAVKVEDKEGIGEDGAYLGNKAITISIVDANNTPIIPNNAITVNSDGSSFEVHFSKS